MVARLMNTARPAMSWPIATSSGWVAWRASATARMSPSDTSWRGVVGHLDADGRAARDGGQDAHVGGRHRVGDVLVEAGDPGDLDPGAQLELVAGDRRARRSCPTSRVSTPWAGERLPRARGPRASTSAAVDLLAFGAGAGATSAAASTDPARARPEVDRAARRAARPTTVPASGGGRARAGARVRRRRLGLAGVVVERRRSAPLVDRGVDQLRVAVALDSVDMRARPCLACAAPARRRADRRCDPVRTATRRSERRGRRATDRPRARRRAATAAPRRADRAGGAGRRRRRRAHPPASSTVRRPRCDVRGPAGQVEQARARPRRPGRRRSAEPGAGARAADPRRSDTPSRTSASGSDEAAEAHERAEPGVDATAHRPGDAQVDGQGGEHADERRGPARAGRRGAGPACHRPAPAHGPRRPRWRAVRRAGGVFVARLAGRALGRGAAGHARHRTPWARERSGTAVTATRIAARPAWLRPP